MKKPGLGSRRIRVNKNLGSQNPGSGPPQPPGEESGCVFIVGVLTMLLLLGGGAIVLLLGIPQQLMGGTLERVADILGGQLILGSLGVGSLALAIWGTWRVIAGMATPRVSRAMAVQGVVMCVVIGIVGVVMIIAALLYHQGGTEF